jgi:hypothetical protein
MFDPQTIAYFARDVLTLAVDHPCSWATFRALERTDDAADLVISAVVVDLHGNTFQIHEREIPVAARLASGQRRVSAGLKAGVLEQNARYLTHTDAHDIIQQRIYRAIRHTS